MWLQLAVRQFRQVLQTGVLRSVVARPLPAEPLGVALHEGGPRAVRSGNICSNATSLQQAQEQAPGAGGGDARAAVVDDPPGTS